MGETLRSYVTERRAGYEDLRRLSFVEELSKVRTETPPTRAMVPAEVLR